MKTLTNPMIYQIPRVEDPMIGRIDYIDSKGSVVDFTDYDDSETFIQDIKDELEWGVAIAITLYSDSHGETISTDFVHGLNCQPVDIRVEEAPTLVLI